METLVNILLGLVGLLIIAVAAFFHLRPAAPLSATAKKVCNGFIIAGIIIIIISFLNGWSFVSMVLKGIFAYPRFTFILILVLAASYFFFIKHIKWIPWVAGAVLIFALIGYALLPKSEKTSLEEIVSGKSEEQNDSKNANTASTTGKSNWTWPSFNQQEPKEKVVIVTDSEKEQVLHDIANGEFVSMAKIEKYCANLQKEVFTLQPGQAHSVTSIPGHRRAYFKQDGSAAYNIKFTNTDNSDIPLESKKYNQAYTFNVQSTEPVATTFIMYDFEYEKPKADYIASN